MPSSEADFQPIVDGRGATILGPRNPARELKNPTRSRRTTDQGTMPNLKWSFADSHMAPERAAGRARPPCANCRSPRTMAGRQHAAQGRRGPRDALAQGGRVGLHDQGQGPDHRGRPGRPHLRRRRRRGRPLVLPAAASRTRSRGSADVDGCEFLLVFDDGSFSEDSTFLLTDWLAHTPKDVLAKNFGVPESAFAEHSREGALHLPGRSPGPLAADRMGGAGAGPEIQPPDAGAGADPHHGRHRAHHRFHATSRPRRRSRRRWSRSSPGGMRELHWHPNGDEWQYYLSGKGRMTVFGSESEGPHLRLPGRRRRLRALRHGPLHREHRRHDADLPRDVPSPRYADISLPSGWR